MEEISRPYTKKEVREKFLKQIRCIVDYWASQDDHSVKDCCDGVAFSILNIFDGTSGGLPAFDIIPSPHPDDKAFSQEEGENWFEPIVINDDCMLHELYCTKSKK